MANKLKHIDRIKVARFRLKIVWTDLIKLFQNNINPVV